MNGLGLADAMAAIEGCPWEVSKRRDDARKARTLSFDSVTPGEVCGGDQYRVSELLHEQQSRAPHPVR